MNKNIYMQFIKILEEELVLALGCTEPISIAYAASLARKHLGCIPERIVVHASGSIIKNVKSVVVPNTNGLKGIKAAVAAGIVAGDSEKELLCIADTKEDDILRIKDYLSYTNITIHEYKTGNCFDLLIEVFADKNCCQVRICNSHTNVVLIKLNDEIILEKDISAIENNKKTDRSILNVKSIINFVNELNVDDVKEIISRQVFYNTNIANEGLKNNYGANIGKVYLKMQGNDVRVRAIAKAAAASDARMNGCDLPVVINAGSGNQGLTCSLPVIEYARELKVSDEVLYKALTLSNLIAIYEKEGIGRLSAYCGAVTAGAAAGAGIAYLHGGSYDEVAHTIVNALAITSGMICDGAKASCAAKLASAIENGILGYHMYINGQEFYAGDGIVTKGVDETIKNISILSTEGMNKTNSEIIKLMIENKSQC